MSYGGARPGAGRKKGGANRMSEKVREAAAKTGVLPHELLLMVARGLPLPGERGKPTRAERIDAAKAAAPYYAPRLAAVVAKVGVAGNPWSEILALVDGSSRGRLPSDKSGVKSIKLLMPAVTIDQEDAGGEKTSKRARTGGRRG